MNDNDKVIMAIEGQMKGILKDLKALRKGTQSQTEATEELGDTAEETGKKLKNAFNIKQLGAWVLSIQKYTNSMIKVTKAQVDYNKSMQRLQVAYGEVNSSGEKLVKTMADLSGLDIAQLTSSLGTFRQFTSSLGLANEEASLLSENLLKFVNDLSSYYGEDFDEMSRKVISGITGEAEALKILGADVTDNAIKQKALNLGIQTNTTNMSAATKAVLRYLLVIDQLKNAQGNYAKTINDVSNQTKIWNAQIDTLKRQLGAFFLPILQTILPVLNGIVMAVNELLGMLLSLFGIEVPFASIVDYSNEYKNNMEGGNEAIQAAQKSLRGFDKLNVIKTPTTSGTGIDYGKVDPKVLEALDKYTDGLDKVKNKAIEIRNTIMEWLGFTKDTNGQWRFSARTLLKNILNSWYKLNSLGKIFVGLGLIKIFTGIVNSLSKIYSFTKKIIMTKIFDKFKLFKDLYQTSKVTGESLITVLTTMEKIQVAIGGIVTAGIGFLTITSAIHDIRENGLDIQNTFSLIIGLVTTFIGVMTTATVIAGGLSAAVGIASGGITIILGLLATLVTNFATTKDTIDECRESMKGLEDTAKSQIDTSETQILVLDRYKKELDKIVDSNGKIKAGYEDRANFLLGELNKAYGTEYKIVDGIIVKYDELGTKIDELMVKKRADNILNAYQDTYNAAIKQNNDLYAEYLTLANKKGELTTKEKQKMNELELQIRSNFTTIRNYEDLQMAAFTNNIGDMEELSKKFYIFSNISFDEAFKNMSETSKANTEELANSMSETLQNSLSKAGNSAASAFIDTVNKRLKETGIEVNGKITTPSLKLKAEGGFLNKGEMFIARERGPEYVGSIGGQTAVANNDQIVDGISAGVAKAIMATGRNVNVNITAEGDADGLLDFITFKQKQKDRQYGF